MTVFEASAKSGYGVESSFIALTEALVEEEETQPRPSSLWGGKSKPTDGIGSGGQSMVDQNDNHSSS